MTVKHLFAPVDIERRPGLAMQRAQVRRPLRARGRERASSRVVASNRVSLSVAETGGPANKSRRINLRDQNTAASEPIPGKNGVCTKVHQRRETLLPSIATIAEPYTRQPGAIQLLAIGSGSFDGLTGSNWLPRFYAGTGSCGGNQEYTSQEVSSGFDGRRCTGHAARESTYVPSHVLAFAANRVRLPLSAGILDTAEAAIGCPPRQACIHRRNMG